jgi:hypothetical protein
VSPADAQQRSGHDDPVDSDAAGGGVGKEGKSPLEPLVANLVEIQEYLSLYITARADLIKASGRRVLVAATIGIAAGALAVTVLVVSAALLLNGCASAIAVIAGGRLWVGQLVVGGGVIIAICGIGAASTYLWLRSVRQATRRKYEHRHQEQRAKFGRRAADAAQH